MCNLSAGRLAVASGSLGGAVWLPSRDGAWLSARPDRDDPPGVFATLDSREYYLGALCRGRPPLSRKGQTASQSRLAEGNR